MSVRLAAAPVRLPPWVGGLVEDVADPALTGPGTIAAGENLVPERAPQLATRGGSRILLTLHDDAGSPAELSHVLGLAPKAATGAVVIGWSSGTTKHYATAVTSDLALAGATEALSRTAFPASWNRATAARPVVASLFEQLYVCDAQPTYASRNPLVVITAAVPPVLSVPTFAFVAGGAGAAALFPYCVEEYNNHLFIAGYGDEEASAGDAPALVRHSFLGRDPGAADGFDKDAYNTIGARGDRVTAMKKGQGLLLVAKANELYVVSGFGRAYPGWQFQVQGVQNTQGFGCENPLALEQAEGTWYGIGKPGPFRTDGVTVESLVGPRQRTWRGIDQLTQAWVRYHPERRLMLFGVHVAADAPDTTAPWVVLAWDLARNVWQPDWKLAGSTTRIFVAQSVATTTVLGPSASPTGPSTTLVTTATWRANWTNGDATAETEYWERETASGSWTLITTIAAGVSLYDRLARVDHTSYQWRVRHVKGGQSSAYAADQTVLTVIDQPAISFVSCDGTHHLTVRVSSDAHGGVTTTTVESSPHGLATWSVEGSFVGVFGANQTFTVYAPTAVDLRARSSDPAWTPTVSAYDSLNNVSCP
jgi:hypothetical protein